MSAITWTAPESEVPSPDYTVSMDGTPVFVYQARVRAAIKQHPGLWTHETDPVGERASFCIADFNDPVEVTVTVNRSFSTATVLPYKAGITLTVDGNTVRFSIEKPQHLTLVLDGSDQQPLHFFLGEPETDIPSPDDPNVIYFGPGVHEITELQPTSGQTIYLAGGAVVKAVLRPNEEGTYNEKWHVTFYHGSVISLHDVEHVRICGRGILDASAVPHPGRPMLHFQGARDITITGITLRDASNWNFVIGSSERITVDGVRIISGRLNSDGINSVNSHGVRIRNCFVRNHDDSIVVKTTQPEPPAEDIQVTDCVVWNDWGYALGVTYETRAAITHVSFTRCSILFARHWCMGIHVSDSATIRDIRFHDIEYDGLRSPANGAYAALAGEPMLLKLSIVEDVWGNDPERGRIRDVLLDGVTIYGGVMPHSELLGLDAVHDIRGVTFCNIRLAGEQPVTTTDALCLERVEFAEAITVA